MHDGSTEAGEELDKAWVVSRYTVDARSWTSEVGYSG